VSDIFGFFLRKQSEMIFLFFYSFVLCVEEENNVNLSYFCFYFFEFVLFCCYPVYDFSLSFFFFDLWFSKCSDVSVSMAAFRV
jgi:hypothetical protein